DLAADADRVDARAVEVLAVQLQLALDTGARDDLVHAVDRPQVGRLPAPGRPDQRGDGLRPDGHVDALDRAERAVVDVQVLGFDRLAHGTSGSYRVFGANTRAMRRASRFNSMTMMIRTRAAVHARSRDGAGGTPGCV